ncbi:MAG: methyltransferase domain-containing protein [Candidatus Promineifilaceae bacterium]
MGKRKDKKAAAQLYARIKESVGQASSEKPPLGGAEPEEMGHAAAVWPEALLAGSKELAGLTATASGQRPELVKMKKFRFQLLHQWIQTHVEPGRVADVGGGKGLLAYLLQESGWTATVVDPVYQALPEKYKDLRSNRQVHLKADQSVPHRNQEFVAAMAQEFDLLVALHAHGCNVQLLDAAATSACAVILLPCCLIQEPLIPPPGVLWIQAVVDYATHKGLHVQPFRLNFKGQNIGIYARRPQELPTMDV